MQENIIYHTNTFLDNFIHHISFNEFSNNELNTEIPVLPDGMTELVINLGEEYYRKYPSNKLELKVNKSHLIGLKSTFCYVTMPQNINSISIRFLPGALSYFVKENMNLLKDNVINAEDLFGNQIEYLENKLDINRVEYSLDVIIKFLVRNFEENYKNKDLRKLIKLMYENSENNKINDLIYFKSDYKRIERLFNEHLGITPKKMKEIISFNKATMLMSKEYSLNDVIYNSGYYDQSHLIKSFKKLSGYSPLKYKKLNYKMLKSNQHVINSMFI